MQPDLIYDLGVNNGRDTEFYLRKGFRVIGVEANPQLYESLSKLFASYISRGQLVLLNIGVWSEPSTLDFYVNLENDHWSSFDPNYGCRKDTRYEVIKIECLTISEILHRFGIPYYMKIDVEGADKHVLIELKNSTKKPPFISVEEFGVNSIDLLYGIGYSKFKILPQRDKSWAIPPCPAVEGSYVERTFNGTDSGLFGKELPGQWLDYHSARCHFLDGVRNENYEFVGDEHEWYDVHASM